MACTQASAGTSRVWPLFALVALLAITLAGRRIISIPAGTDEALVRQVEELLGSSAIELPVEAGFNPPGSQHEPPCYKPSLGWRQLMYEIGRGASDFVIGSGGDVNSLLKVGENQVSIATRGYSVTPVRRGFHRQVYYNVGRLSRSTFEKYFPLVEQSYGSGLVGSRLSRLLSGWGHFPVPDGEWIHRGEVDTLGEARKYTGVKARCE